MKKNYSLLLLTLIMAVYVSSCNNEPELVYDSNTNGIEMTVWEIDRMLHDSKSSSKGEELVTADGDLEYLLKSIYNNDDADLDVSKLSKKSIGYKIEVKSSDAVKLREGMNEALASWLTDAGFEVYYGEEDREIYVLTVENEDRLLENIYESVDGRTNYLKTTSKEMVLEGSIKHLVQALEKQESSKPIELSISDTLKSKLFAMTLSRNDGFEGIVEQLSDQYGIHMQKEVKRRKVLIVK